MITYLPYREYDKTAEVLTDFDLQKQTLHVIMLLNALHETDEQNVRAWGNHPAAAMWRGYEVQLSLYGLAMCAAEMERGFSGSEERSKRMQWHYDTATFPDDFKMEKPPWYEAPELITWVERTHRSALISREPAWYSKIWPEIPRDLTISMPKANGQE